MHICEWTAILWLPPWVSPSPYCPAGGKEAKQVNVAPLYHVPPHNCTTHTAQCKGSQHKSMEHYRPTRVSLSTKIFRAWEFASVTRKYFSRKKSATDPEIHKSRLHPISPGCTSMIANCHKCEQRNRLNKIFALIEMHPEIKKERQGFSLIYGGNL